MDTERAGVLFALAKDEFQGEIDRLSRVERKAFVMLSSLTLLVGLYGALLGWVIKTCLPPAHPMAWIIIVLVVAALAGLVWSWFMAYSALKIDDRAYVDVDAALIEYFEATELATIYRGMSIRFSEGSCHNRDLTGRKVKKITKAYHGIVLTGLLLLVLAARLAYQVWPASPTEPGTTIHVQQSGVKNGQ